MNRVPSANLIVLGEVLRPHGREGLLRVRSYASSAESFLTAGSVFVEPAGGGIQEFTVSSAKPHKDVFLMRLKEVSSAAEAETFRGAKIMVLKKALKKESEDEYFWYELLGLEVYVDSGRCLGQISQIIPTGSNDIYVVRAGTAEILIPATHEVVREIDLERRRMMISPMEGLLDLDEV